jgi:metacaspase-1
MKKAICVGINNYPGTANDLQGCVNDANDWAALLQTYGFETSIILDSQATRQNVKAALTNLVTSAGEGDVVVLTYSGHGTQVMDMSGDESDNLDEAIYVYDGSIVDDDLRTIINQIKAKATLVVISDSCFSGTVTRLIPQNARPRFIRTQDIPAGKTARKHFLLPESSMPEVLISGCSDTEYSYDADINGRANGAMSALAIQVIKQNPKATYGEFYTSLRALLPSSEYPQTPQLEGSDDHKNTKLFEPFDTTVTPPPVEDTTCCLVKFWRRIVQFFKGG